MREQSIIPHFEVAIIGAGPAGTAAALALKDGGLTVALLDKKAFPRHKTCGDAIPSPSFKYLRKIIPNFDEELEGLELKQLITTSKVYSTNGKSFAIKWNNVAYNSPRSSFDTFLFNQVKKHTDTTVYEDCTIKTIKQDSEGVFTIYNKQTDPLITAKMVLGADGANSVVTRELLNSTLDKDFHCTAVAAYYSNINCPNETNEFYLFKKHLPGYFWIFPLGNNQYNVGFGLMAAKAEEEKRNLKQNLDTIIKEEPILRESFKNATALSDTKGFGLPLGGKERPISGDGFMMLGDAAYLIDPLQGHGIDKAIRSGIIAAKNIETSFKENNFSAEKLKQYDVEVYQTMGKELKRNYRLMKWFYKRMYMMDAITTILNVPLVKKGMVKLFYKKKPQL